MAQKSDSPQRGFKAQVRGSLVIAVVLALVAFLGIVIFATGGTNNTPNFVLALTVAGAVFVVTLVMCATLILVEKPNDESLGEGTGINRSSAKLYAEAKARRETEAKRREAEEKERLAKRIDQANAGEQQGKTSSSQAD
ncbi:MULTISPECIES: hypothetical protein [Rothia]|uniref:hypothetical protein n=1 Tax=Rothia TaxID=32207 RepID=UPI001F35E5E0|nr:MULTISPECIES: hypothetical protein [Rothia]